MLDWLKMWFHRGRTTARENNDEADRLVETALQRDTQVKQAIERGNRHTQARLDSMKHEIEAVAVRIARATGHP